MNTKIERRIEKLEETSRNGDYKVHVITITDGEDADEALNKYCLENNVERDHLSRWPRFIIQHFISTKWADEQKALGNW